MLERITDDVYVDVRPGTVSASTPVQRVASLQYVVLNVSSQHITVRLNFSQSQHIRLIVPLTSDQHPAAADSHEVTITVAPLRRVHAAHVVRADSDRAYVRVEYAVVDATEGLTCDLDHNLGDDDCDAVLVQRVAHSALTFSWIKKRRGFLDLRMRLPLAEVGRWCGDINRWSRRQRVDFVDPTFPPSRASLGENALLTGASPISWRHLRDVVDTSWCLVDVRKKDKKSKGPDDKRLPGWSGGLLDQDNWICAIDALHSQAPYWCKRWFGENMFDGKKMTQLDERSVVTVRLCLQGREWVPVVIDLFMPVLGVHTGGFVSAWPYNGEYYAVLLQKACAKLSGCYAALSTLPTRLILQVLTGAPVTDLLRDESANEVFTRLKLRFATEPSSSRRVTCPVMVSFGAFDDHHRAFEIVQVTSRPEHASAQLQVRDPNASLQAGVTAKIGAKIYVGDDEGLVLLPEELFLQLSPALFELRLDQRHSWRRRKFYQRRLEREATLQVAISCDSLQDIIVRAYSRRHADGSTVDVELISINVDQVEDDGSWRRPSYLEHKEEASRQGAVAGAQRQWTAAAGEYVVSLSVAAAEATHFGSDGSASMLTPKTVHENFDLLFRCLDQDMDGVISKSELAEFIFRSEGIAPADYPALRTAIDDFLRKHSSSEPSSDGSKTSMVLTKEDLHQVYEHVAGASDWGRRSDGIACLVWSDLCNAITNGQDAEIQSIVFDDVYELSCVVSSDRLDVSVAVV